MQLVRFGTKLRVWLCVYARGRGIVIITVHSTSHIHRWSAEDKVIKQIAFLRQKGDMKTAEKVVK